MEPLRSDDDALNVCPAAAAAPLGHPPRRQSLSGARIPQSPCRPWQSRKLMPGSATHSDCCTVVHSRHPDPNARRGMRRGRETETESENLIRIRAIK